MHPKPNPHAVEIEVRDAFNLLYGTNATKQRVLMPGGLTRHELDMFERDRVAGGITTVPWRNRTGSSNTAGQDRAALELAWLHFWEGPERRVLVLTDEEMATKLPRRLLGIRMRAPIEVLHYELATARFAQVAVLGGGAVDGPTH